jgi:hypothetical protein
MWRTVKAGTVEHPSGYDGNTMNSGYTKAPHMFDRKGERFASSQGERPCDDECAIYGSTTCIQRWIRTTQSLSVESTVMR